MVKSVLLRAEAGASGVSVRGLWLRVGVPGSSHASAPNHLGMKQSLVWATAPLAARARDGRGDAEIKR